MPLFKRNKKETKNAKQESSIFESLATPHKIQALEGLVEALRIGSSIGLHPEYKADLILRSLIMGYCIDGHLVFRQQNLDFSQPGRLLMTNEEGQALNLDRVNSFSLIIPTETGEMELDVDKRAELGSGSLFRRHNNLTVVSLQNSGGNIQVDAEVLKRQAFKSGLYNGHEVAHLELHAGTERDYDPRSQSRVQTQLQGTLQFNPDKITMAVQVLDVSEKFVRIGMIDADSGGVSNKEWPYMSTRHPMVLSISAPQQEDIHILCNISLARPPFRVLEIKGMIKNGVERPYNSLDALQLKISLSNA